jgi:predicted TIM-barrel fold metal-dependent hydrolase
VNDRRTFLKAAAAAGLSAAIATASPEAHAADDALPIVDCHQHLWDLTQFRLPWIEKGSLLDRNYVTEDYLQAAKGLNIAQAVYMEVDVAPDQKKAEADYLVELCRGGKTPTRAAVVGGELTSDKFADYITPYRGNPFIKGVRQVIHSPSLKAGTCLSPTFVSNVQLLGKLGLSFDLCPRPAELSDGVKLVDKCPETRFIVDHCGNADVKAWLGEKRRGGQAPGHEVDAWKKDIAALADRKNVIGKISGIIARVPKEWSADDLAPIVNHCLDSFGPDRVIFGSDWPVCLLGASYRQWVTTLKEIISSRPADEQKKLLSENAIKFYAEGAAANSVFEGPGSANFGLRCRVSRSRGLRSNRYGLVIFAAAPRAQRHHLARDLDSCRAGAAIRSDLRGRGWDAIRGGPLPAWRRPRGDLRPLPRLLCRLRCRLRGSLDRHGQIRFGQQLVASVGHLGRSIGRHLRLHVSVSIPGL